jgi:pimeloyl-ACP methyl ester carboxylesterase
MWEAVFGYNRIDELLRDDLRVTGVIDKVGVKKFYATLLEDIGICGFTENSADKRFLPFPYDWRRSNRDSAQQLANRLDEVLSGFDIESVDILLLAHSMGGLVMRYLLESGEYSNHAWFPRIKWLVTLGTPHFGAPIALHRLAGKEGTVGLSGGDVKRLGNDSRYPALFELVPPASTGFTSTKFGEYQLPSNIDPFAPPISVNIGMNPGNIAAARQFWNGLDLRRRPPAVEYFWFFSSSHRTLVRNELMGQAGDILEIMREESGDGTVPVGSASLATVPHGYSEKKHESVFLDRRVRSYLYRLLGAPSGVIPQAAPGAPPVGAEDAMGLSLNKESYAKGEEIELGVSFNKLRSDPRVSFSFIQIDPQTGGEVGSVKDFQVQFRGVAVRSFRAVLENDLAVGMYELKSANPVDDADPTYFVIREKD